MSGRAIYPWRDVDRHAAAAGMDTKALATTLGMTVGRLNYIRRQGYVTSALADRTACALGMHVLNIWPEWEKP